MKTIINIKADKEVKEGAQKLAAELGLPLSTIVNASLKEFIRNGSITLSRVPRMSKYLESIIGRVERDIKLGRNLSPAFDNAEDAITYLDSQ